MLILDGFHPHTLVHQILQLAESIETICFIGDADDVLRTSG
jgi:hypothetical protein